MLKETNVRRRAAGGWLHLGASGLLQPLSEEFLYRAAPDALHTACRWCARPAAGKRHAR